MRLALAIICAWTIEAAAATGPLVYAASSLSDALTAAADAFATSGRAKPNLSFAGSSALARQIENGAPADLFLSADEQWMDYLSERGLIDRASRINLLQNRLVLIAPRAAPFSAELTGGAQLKAALKDGKLALADPDAVPAGRYAKAALQNLNAWRDLEPHVVRAENVRAALALVARGEAAAGVVYATDARATDDVIVVAEFPSSSHPPVIFPLALVGKNPSTDARAFYLYLAGEDAAQIFTKFGFMIRGAP